MQGQEATYPQWKQAVTQTSRIRIISHQSLIQDSPKPLRVPSQPDTPNEHSPQMSDVDNRAANLIFSDDECPSIQARPDTDEEFWLHHWNSRNARRQDKETTPNQLLHEAQRDRILDYFYHSKALDASPEEVEKWVDNLIAADPDAFVPDLFSDEDSNYSEEEFVVDKEYADMLRSESKESKKKFWLVQQCLQYRRKLQKRRRRGYDTPSDYNSAAFWGDGREFWGQNPHEEGGGDVDTLRRTNVHRAMKKGEHPPTNQKLNTKPQTTSICNRVLKKHTRRPIA